MNRFETMRVFARVAETASFTRAAESLGMPRSAVSTAVQQLEGTLGTRLLHRTTRRVEMTPDGQAAYERCRDLLADVDELESMFREGPQALAGRLRVDLPTRVARNFVIPRLPALLAAHPGLEIELSCTDRLVDVVREGFDCVLRVGTLQDSSLVARTLGAFPVVNCASPAYLKHHGRPRSLDDLARHHIVHYTPHLGARPFGWEYFDGTRYRTRTMAGAITVNNTDAYEAACVAGLGMIQAPRVGLEALIREGQLVELLPKLRAEPMPVSLIYAHRRNLPKRVRLFMDWVADILSPHLVPITPSEAEPEKPGAGRRPGAVSRPRNA